MMQPIQPRFVVCFSVCLSVCWFSCLSACFVAVFHHFAMPFGRAYQSGIVEQASIACRTWNTPQPSFWLTKRWHKPASSCNFKRESLHKSTIDFLQHDFWDFFQISYSTSWSQPRQRNDSTNCRPFGKLPGSFLFWLPRKHVGLLRRLHQELRAATAWRVPWSDRRWPYGAMDNCHV